VPKPDVEPEHIDIAGGEGSRAIKGQTEDGKRELEHKPKPKDSVTRKRVNWGSSEAQPEAERPQT